MSGVQHVQLENADRRRLVVATIITIVALPTLWLTGRDRASDGVLSPVAIAVNGGAVADVTRHGATSAADDTPVFMAGPTTPPVPEPEIVTPTPRAEQASGRATFRRWDSTTMSDVRGYPCQSVLAPIGTRLTITNVNNGRSVRCVNVLLEPPTGGAIVTLHTDALLAIGKLADAPLSVRVTW